MIRKMIENDLYAISQLEEDIYSIEMSLGYDDFKYDFHKYKQYSYVSEINNKLQGYIFAYQKGKHIYISDFVCKHKSLLLPLWIVFCKENENKVCFAECREHSYLLLKRLSDWIEIKREHHLENYYDTEDAYDISIIIKPILNRKYNFMYYIYKNNWEIEQIKNIFELTEDEYFFIKKEIKKAKKLR